jgi:5-methylcytosine-specific restriction endonuclease McrA
MQKIIGLALCLVFVVPAVDAGQQRSRTARAEFVRVHHCPATGRPRGVCPGWVVDHIKALACGGADAPANMQWQTVEDAKSKDKWERKGCRGRGVK